MNLQIKDDTNIALGLTWRYVFALTLIAALSTSAWFSLELIISRQKSTAAIVNISGRQRMLSQRTALLSNLLVHAQADQRPKIHRKLRESIELMSQSHFALIHGDKLLGLPSTMSETVNAMYFKGENPLNTQVDEYVKSVDELLAADDKNLTTDNATLLLITNTALTRLSSSLDKMVHQYQLEGEASIVRLEKIETLLWTLTLLLLAFEAALIFYPFTKFTKLAIEKLHQITRELKFHEEYLETIIEQRTVELSIAATAFESHEGILVTDANNVILRANQAFLKISGYSEEEVIGQSPRLFRSGKHEVNFFDALWNSINNTGMWEGEIWNKRKNGEVYPVHLTITAVKANNGKVTNYVSTLTDITVSKAASDEIQRLAFYDPLTQLPNRRLLVDRLNQALANSARSGQRGALLFLDLDHFKTLNDTLGHDIGDLLLEQTATRLLACVREGDTVARIGGDEFVVFIENLSDQPFDAAAQAEIVGEKILNELNLPYLLSSHRYFNASSIGITLFNGSELELEELLKQADIAMYQAKKAGRNTLRFFDPNMQEVINARVELERDLRQAIENKEFQLYYQLQVDGDGRSLGAEALIRWNQPKRGLVSPFNFIPLAEETGLILPIGQWVLDAACSQLKAWEQNPLTNHLSLSINVSAQQFKQADFVSQVQTSVQHHAINPNLLKIELTESMLLDNVEHIIITMVALQAIGIRFELDDFGTGYSSLQYLKKLPLQQLKIDQSFIQDITEDSSDQAIVRTIIAMARGLNIDVIAEGVETDNQLAYLRNYGCNHFQGYLFGRPAPINEFETLLESSRRYPRDVLLRGLAGTK
ncbi:EAL domain-containing protein [Methylotenera versatilis]|nr:EAL domain-containing protein [Methylotenera versatilis]